MARLKPGQYHDPDYLLVMSYPTGKRVWLCQAAPNATVCSLSFLLSADSLPDDAPGIAWAPELCFVGQAQPMEVGTY